jgi:DNA-binding HxlR family transcriptional regulator/SAM-dependent methyltransferase
VDRGQAGQEPRCPPEVATPGRDVGTTEPSPCRAREILQRVGDKWSMYVIDLLGEGTKRFSELHRAIDGITSRMLTVTLRGLERDGIVTRTIHPVIPPRVEYELTPMGRTLLDTIGQLVAWADSHVSEIDAARAAYDVRHPRELRRAFRGLLPAFPGISLAMVDETAEESADRLLHGSSFGAVASDYALHRPGYAEAAIRWCLEPVVGDGTRPPRVVDIGAGTGIMTGALDALGADVTAVEPDQDMLAELRHQLPGVRARQGSAEAIPLPDGSADAVLAAQSMHWFDMERALPEIARVLVPGGVLAGLWNVDDDRIDWVAELAEMSSRQAANTLLRWRAGYGRSRQEKLLQAGGELFGAGEEHEFINSQRRTADSLVATVSTHSHLLVMGEADRSRVLAQVGDFLRSQPETADGVFTLPLVTMALRARRLPTGG